VGTEGEFIDVGTLAAKVEYANLPVELGNEKEITEQGPCLGVGHTAVVPRLGVGLILAVAVAASGTTTHCKLNSYRMVEEWVDDGETDRAFYICKLGR